MGAEVKERGITRGWGATVPRMLRHWPETGRRIVAAVCYRLQPQGEIQFLLVRTHGGRWTFPKGGVDLDGSAAAAAMREAYEEAGVVGRAAPQPFAGYVHCKTNRTVQMVSAYLCQVLRLERPLEHYRCPTWFSMDKAKQRLGEQRENSYAKELEQVIDRAVECLSRQAPAPFTKLLLPATPAE